MSDQTEQYGVILVTAPSQQEAEMIAETLIGAKLAACATILPVQSVYTWQGEVHNDQEWQLLIKSKLSRFEELETKIRQIHPYEVPEIIAVPIVAGSQPYLTWISQQVSP